MKSEQTSFEGHGTASDKELELISDEILNLLKEFNSPKDAGSAFTLAHYKLITAAFPPGFKDKAIDAVEAHSKLLIEFLNEGWN